MLLQLGWTSVGTSERLGWQARGGHEMRDDAGLVGRSRAVRSRIWGATADEANGRRGTTATGGRNKG